MTREESYLMAVLGRELYRMSLGSARPVAGRMRDPRPGDLVLEVSVLAPMTPERFDPDMIGRLVRIEHVDPAEAVHRNEERWVVAPLHDPEREQGWRSATFTALPDRWKWAEPS